MNFTVLRFESVDMSDDQLLFVLLEHLIATGFFVVFTITSVQVGI